MLKLTSEQADEILIKSQKLNIDNPYLRVGQSIWISIPNEYLRQYTDNSYEYNQDVDFFYEKDSTIAYDKFYKYFVEE